MTSAGLYFAAGIFHRRHAIPSKEMGSKGKLLAFALVAQWIEQEPSNLLVAGSIPAEGAPPDSQASCTRLAQLTALSRCSGSIPAEGAHSDSQARFKHVMRLKAKVANWEFCWP
jgi:hypothetical protein